MMADHGTNRYMLYKKRRAKQTTPAKGDASGTNKYTPMYKTTQIKNAGSIRDNNQTMYHMMGHGGPASLIPRKKSGGNCGCKGGSVSKSMGILYKKK